MQILATGVTKQQCGGGVPLGYEPVADLLVKALRRLGHHYVDHRVVAAGEPLEGRYDAVLLGIVPFFSIASHYLYPALHVLGEARRLHLPVVLYVDDWNFGQLIANLKTHVRMPWQLTKPFFQGRHDRNWAVDHAAELMDQVTFLLREPWPPLVIPTFTWGEHDRLGDLLPNAGDVTYVDPTAFARSYPIERVPPADRRREWVLGTVSNQLEWVAGLNLTWPLNHLGTRTSRAPRKLPEAELVNLYGQAWGVLSPAYPKILGTGWWRNRYVYATAAKAILLGDPGEAPGLGEAYQLKPGDVEDLTTSQLQDLAAAQFRAFWNAVESPVGPASDLENALQRATEWATGQP